MSEDKTNRAVWLATGGLLVLLTVGAFLGWRLYLARQVPPAQDAPQATVAAAVDAGAVDLAEGDALLRSAAGDLSTEALLASWLAEPDLVRRLVAATFQVSRGESPAELLAFLRPAGDFAVDEVEVVAPGAKPKAKAKAKPKRRASRSKKPPPPRVFRATISAASYARYDLVARVLGSVDTARLGGLYLKLAPFAEMALREAAPAGRTLEGVFGAAVDHLAEVPLSDAPVEVVPMKEGVSYAFKDEKLEALSPAQKHLLRMGPGNARIVVEKLKAFRAAVFSGRADAGR
jgi:hypothetical protein